MNESILDEIKKLEILKQEQFQSLESTRSKISTLYQILQKDCGHDQYNQSGFTFDPHSSPFDTSQQYVCHFCRQGLYTNPYKLQKLGYKVSLDLETWTKIKKT